MLPTVLFPDHPLIPPDIEPDFAIELAGATAAGFPSALVSYEGLMVEGGAARAVRRVRAGAGATLYRGWMLKPAAYERFDVALRDRGAPLLVPPAAYTVAHHLPGWYDLVRPYTATSVWLPADRIDDAALIALLGRLPPGPALVKDYVKSAKHRWAEACFVPDTRDTAAALTVIHTFLADQGADLNGGVVLRQFRPYPSTGIDPRTGMPLITERRVFVWRGTPLMLAGDEDTLLSAPLRAAVAKVPSPFVSVDLARLPDATWEVVEVGDGQVSGLRLEMDAFGFYRALADALETPAGGG
jgi:hypothetical protein